MARRSKKEVGNEEVQSNASARNDKEQEYFERLKDLYSDRADINAQITEVAKLAKDAGINTRVLRATVQRALESDEDRSNRLAFERQRDEMQQRLGILFETPLGQAANDAAARSAAS